MVKFLLWLILFVICWPVALLAIVAYPFVFLFLLPFRLAGFAIEGVLAFLRALMLLPSRVIGGRR